MKLVRRSSFVLAKDNSHLKSLDDDLSVSSVHSTISVSETKTVDSHAFLRRRQRRVKFDESQNEYHANTQMVKEECQELWYSFSDMKNFKAQTGSMAREIYRAEKVNTATYSYSRVVLAAYDACCRVPCETIESPLTKLERKNLHKWMEVGLSRSGLERSCIREIAQDKSNRRSQIVDSVLDIQESLAFREDFDDVLRKATEAISRPSRLFAREVAMAQAASL